MPLVIAWSGDADAEAGLAVTIRGEASFVVREEVTPDGPRYVSEAYKQPQEDLRRALRLGLDNLVNRAFRQAWDLAAMTPEQRASFDAGVTDQVRTMIEAVLADPNAGLDARKRRDLKAVLARYQTDQAAVDVAAADDSQQEAG